ncbi:uncharacterized protein [Danio rerio]|uniref:ribonuclease H n=1 Tax=Danio rerio TaxID=7955 RepID=A0A8M9PQ45_DANRE|nr:uncharacterized protein LOC110438198 [Danio rerio]|eukprot:XP_021324376.1 uncharacterized protein LOC110438198 [Danio rerio]
MATPKSAPSSSRRPHRVIQRPAYLDDYIVNYAGNPSSHPVGPKEKAIMTSTPITTSQSYGTAGSSEDFMQQMMEITKQQSETARRQTELLEKVLLHSSLQASTPSSRASSRHQTPRTRILQSVEKGQPTSEVSPDVVRIQSSPWPLPNNPPTVEELSQSLRKTHLRDTYFQSPPPVSRETTLTSHQYATPYSSSPLDQIRTHQHNQAEPWTKPLPPLPGQQPIQTTQPHFYNIPPAAVHPVHSRFVSVTEPMPQTSYQATSQFRANTVPYAPPPPSYWSPTVEGPTFPDFYKEDRAQYVELRMALDNLLHPQIPENYKYSILLKHVKVPNAHRLVLAHAESVTPYTNALQALDRRYGRPYQFVLREIETLENLPAIRAGDERAFDEFSLRVQAIVGMLKALKDDGIEELHSGSNVKRLLNRLPRSQQTQFRRHHLKRNPDKTKFSLLEFADWLQLEANCLEFDPTDTTRTLNRDQRAVTRQQTRQTSILHGVNQRQTTEQVTKPTIIQQKAPNKHKPVCPYCNAEHYLGQCTAFNTLTKEQIVGWIKENKRCWKCARLHMAKDCDLQKPCHLCQAKHLSVLHDINQRKAEVTNESSSLYNSTTETLYLDQPRCGGKVFLKVVKVTLHYQQKALDTFAILDDGSERTILLATAANHLGLKGKPEQLNLRTVHQDIRTLHGTSVSFCISTPSNPGKRYAIHGAFTAEQFGLAEYTYPVSSLQKRYRHLRGVPIPPLHKACPLLLIGSDHTELITPTEPVLLGPPGGPAAIRTRLGWALQGPSKHVQEQLPISQCLFTSNCSPSAELYHQIEKLWQMDILPYRSEKIVVRSQQDQEALNMLETQTVQVKVDGIDRYATPLLRVKTMTLLNAPKEAVMCHLRSTERCLTKDPPLALKYQEEIKKLENAGYATKIPPQEAAQSTESWYLPHHIVTHNGKHRVVFNCSYTYNGENLNKQLLPGPTLGPTLLGVLIRFREHRVAISGDIKGMFHQVRLLPKDKPLLRFLWRDLNPENPPDVYEWQVLPFGTTCSPCCATFAVQRHVFSHCQQGDKLRQSVEHSFYVDNCLQSTSSAVEARELIDGLRSILASGGFEIRQWASNEATVVRHLPKEAKSENTELWISQSQADPHEMTMGLSWHCVPDTLHYRRRPLPYQEVTMRNIYRVLASQYDPLGYIIPFTTRAKIIVRQLWAKEREWDDPLLPSELLQAWQNWEAELNHLPKITMPRCYVSATLDIPEAERELHIFCDASAEAYGSVAYLRTEHQGQIELAFIHARSRVSPKRQQSVPRLELCAALTGAQLAKLLHNELSLKIKDTFLWSDSTTVLTWIKSESCRFKVFVGTRVTEIQELTEGYYWRFVDSGNNVADDITRGKSLLELSQPNRWSKGPDFLYLPPVSWPESPSVELDADLTELRNTKFCGLTLDGSGSSLPDANQFSTFEELLEATCRSLHGAAGETTDPEAIQYRQAETDLLRRAQTDSFPSEYNALTAGKPIPSSSRLLSLSPELDKTAALIRVGGRLRQAQHLCYSTVHPIVLDPNHPITRLLIKQYDAKLGHPGPERVFAEMRRYYWILRGREAIRRHQRSCVECQRWRAKPNIPKMAELPPARLRLMKPPFFSTGVDCFGPFLVKRGRSNEKKWGIIFKCMTTRCVHLDLLANMDTDSFLMALRRMVARRGTPSEILADQGTNFRGGDKELQTAFTAMSPDLQAQLAKQKIQFHYNPPNAPHFGGMWEREIRSVKAALHTIIGPQTLTEEVLRTLLIEVEAILNAKPLGYVSSDLADPDPVTPNYLLMGRPDVSLPQVIYPESEILSRKRWRHSQVLADQFWTSFIKNYLPTLQQRQKWMTDTSNLTPGTVVMIIDHQLPRALWPVGKVVTTYLGLDGRVRSATIEVKNKQYHRPVARLITLPSIPDDNPTTD